MAGCVRDWGSRLPPLAIRHYAMTLLVTRGVTGIMVGAMPGVALVILVCPNGVTKGSP
jgi:hypothetical protein